MIFTPRGAFFTSLLALLLAPQHGQAQATIGSYSLRKPEHVVFLGRALTDTVWVGTGPMKPNGRGARPVYGQRFEVLRVGNHWKHLVDLARPIIIVQWSNGSDTEPGGAYYFGGSARFAAPGLVAVYSGALRPGSANGKQGPILDAVSMIPYDGTLVSIERVDSTPRNLTPTELLELVEALPRADSIAIDPINASNALRAWITQHPDLAVLNPAVQHLGGVRYTISDVRQRRTPSPVAGTYRVEVELPWGEQFTYFARTEISATDSPYGARDRKDSIGRSGPPWSHSLVSTHALTETALPDEYEGPDQFKPWFHNVTIDPIVRTRDSVVWRGEVDGLRVAVSLERDPARRARMRELFLRSEKERSDTWYWMPGAWILKPGEPIRFEWTVRNEKEVFYTVRAVQVSERTLKLFVPEY